ncbi:LOW QUALITY PROTEIN: secretogranin-2 [Meleagris gallopavo]|uniref:LOW QUALITY PROTEIN: secretogranin-2 n=1 Tax=Meleagris gallopavo TaxID=9103 RepID=UPI000549DD5E|nr:LOW QUALITY PROTEIN: secretogranin-2 [Meleagris gallopavo]
MLNMAETKTIQLGAVCAVTFFFVLICWADAASFQQYQLLQKDPDYVMKNLQRLPNPDMIKALEYIEDLRKQASKGESIPDYNSFQSVPYVLQQKENKDQVHLPENIRDSLTEDESQWVKVMLEALRQAEKESKAGTKENKLYGLSSDNSFPAGVTDDYEAYKWPERWQKYLKMPLGHYEDSSRDSPFKRTNEIVEEQYTPQSLATLESVFQELGKMAGPSNHKKERLDEDQKLYADDEDDVYKVNNIAYEDVVGGEDWNPIEEKVESQTQEEIKDSKEEIDKHEEEVDDEMKRSGKLSFLEDEMRRDNKDQMSENVSKLMNYYLKRLMGSAGNRKLRTGGELEEKRAATILDKQLNPQSIAQLIEMSRNLQIPPEDLIDMLKAGEKNSFRVKGEAEQEAEFPEDLDEITETNLGQSDIFKNNVNSKSGYMKQPLSAIPENLPEDLNIEDIVSLLGTGNLGNQNPSYLLNRLNQENDLPRMPYIPRRLKGRPVPKSAWINDLERRQMEYEKLDEKDEELADYLAKMLAKYPEVINANQMKRVPVPASESDLQEDERLEQAIREHLSQLGPQEAARLASLSKRLSMAGDTDDTQNRQYLDEDMLAKVLEYLKQEKSELERDHITKRAMENM